MPENERHEQSRRAERGAEKNATHSPSDFHPFVGGRSGVGNSYNFDFLFRFQKRALVQRPDCCLFVCPTVRHTHKKSILCDRPLSSRALALRLFLFAALASFPLVPSIQCFFIFAFSRSFPCCYFISCLRLALCESPLFRRSSGGTLLEHTRRPRPPDNRAIPSDRISNGNWLSRRCFEK